MQLAELQKKLNFRPPRVSITKAGERVWREQSSVSWNGMCGKTDEAENTDLLNSEVFFFFAHRNELPTLSGSSTSTHSGTACSISVCGNNPAFPKETIMAFPEVAAKHDTTSSP